MARLILMPVIGVVLILVGVVYLVMALQGTDNALVAPLFQMVCEDGETIQMRKTYNSTRGGDSLNFHCEDAEANRRDVSAQITIIIAGGFLLFFGGGMLMLFGFAVQIKNLVIKNLDSGNLTVVNSESDTRQ